jgi:hypothetical protein
MMVVIEDKIKSIIRNDDIVTAIMREILQNNSLMLLQNLYPKDVL